MAPEQLASIRVNPAVKVPFQISVISGNQR